MLVKYITSCTHLSSTISEIYSDISVASREVNDRFSVFYHILLSPGYAPGTIVMNVTRLERGFNACKTSCCIYPSIFNHF